VIELSTAVIRLGLALAFGAVIGVEREWRLKQAGLKTMSLVAMGAAAFGMMTDTFGDDNHNPGQIAAAVVGGIGFLGAGVIMRRGVTVQGLTTAATLWASASVGVASGLGQVPPVEFGHIQAAHQDRLQCAAAIECRDTEEDLGTTADPSHEGDRELGGA